MGTDPKHTAAANPATTGEHGIGTTAPGAGADIQINPEAVAAKRAEGDKRNELRQHHAGLEVVFKGEDPEIQINGRRIVKLAGASAEGALLADWWRRQGGE